jgi:hypothetical protein
MPVSSLRAGMIHRKSAKSKSFLFSNLKIDSWKGLNHECRNALLLVTCGLLHIKAILSRIWSSDLEKVASWKLLSRVRKRHSNWLLIVLSHSAFNFVWVLLFSNHLLQTERKSVLPVIIVATGDHIRYASTAFAHQNRCFSNQAFVYLINAVCSTFDAKTHHIRSWNCRVNIWYCYLEGASASQAKIWNTGWPNGKVPRSNCCRLAKSHWI